MEFEVLKKSHVKRNIVIGVVAVLIISAIILNFTSAKYRATDSVPLINGTINYKPYDFKVMAMYQESDTGEYTEIEEMPSSGYTINEEKSYCTTDNVNKDENAKLYTLSTGEHVFSGLKKSSKCYLYFDKKTLLAADTILTGKDIQTRTDFSIPVTDTTTGVMYQTTDWKGTSYYFAGNPTDNWIYFEGYYWRIVRINGDGSVRLIYNGTSTTTTGKETLTNISKEFNDSYSWSIHVGLKYTRGEQHGQNTDSPILNTLQSWYSSSGLSYSQYIDTNIGFCSDRNVVSGESWDESDSHNYAAYGRLVSSKEPSLDCNNSGDIIKEPVGLITADELAYAGGVYEKNNTSYYLYNNQAYWTMTPYYFDFMYYAYVFNVNSNGQLVFDMVNSAYGVRPVINLKADTKFTGEGTVNSPFEVAS